MICEEILAALGSGGVCEETDIGARVVTHCLYPSFTPVSVYVSKIGDGYRITDGGAAIRIAWSLGRDDEAPKRLLGREAGRFHVSVSGAALVTTVPSADWLKAAILAVANASSAAAYTIIGKVAVATEDALKDRIRATLERLVPPKDVGQDFEVTGRSGDNRHFDYGLKLANDNYLVVSAVAPHHSSIAAKYVAFADTRGLERVAGFAVYDRQLEPGDTSLMMQVADLLPISALDPKMRKVLAI